MAGLEVELGQEAPIPLSVRLACPPGELLALVGPSGSGKTTILRAIAGLFRPARGRVVADGAVWLDTRAKIDLPTRHRRVGFVFQSYALFPHMSALDNVAAAMGHRPRVERAERARALLRLVHLEGLEDRKPAQLSGGQQQRVAVARALMQRARLVLADEPVASLDPALRHSVMRHIEALNREEGMTVLCSLHDLDLVERYAHRVVALKEGRLVFEGAPASFDGATFRAIYGEEAVRSAAVASSEAVS
ncbi:MAG: ATP-binding cassette domain-containing protein [Geminicoccaceae bacterium]|nr:ATP-binding cassette domain-containing protein [Geminicoccaceae bacterium]